MFLKPPLGYMTVQSPGDRGRILKRPAKNPDHAAVTVYLEQAFDECTSLHDVLRRLAQAGVQRPAFRGRGGETTIWSIQTLLYILRNPIYTGTYVFGRFDGNRRRSTVWNKFAVDEDGAIREFVHHVPELACWEPARVRRWQRKFSQRNGPRTRNRSYPHPLAGVLVCNSCGQQMTGAGKDKYSCSSSNHGGARKNGPMCERPQWLSGRVIMALLRTVLPEVMFGAQELAAETIRQAGDRKPSAAEQRLAYLEQRAERLADDYAEMDTPSEALKAKLQEIQREINRLRDQVAEEQDERVADEQLAASLGSLVGEPLKLFDTLPEDKRARIHQILFRGVRVSCDGRGVARRWRLLEYAPAFGAETLMVTDSAVVRLPNPADIRIGKSAAGSLVIEESQTQVVTTCPM